MNLSRHSLSRRGLLAATTATALTSASPAAAAGGGGGSGGGSGAGRRLRTGFERLAADGYALLDGERVGIVTNPTGVTRDVRHIVDVMHADDRVNLVAVFGPEHGFRGTARNQRTTSATESMLRSVTVQLCASSRGRPVRLRICLASLVKDSRTGCRSLSLVRRLIENPWRPAWVMSMWTATCRRPPSITKVSRNSGCSSRRLAVRHEHRHQPDVDRIACDLD